MGLLLNRDGIQEIIMTLTGKTKQEKEKEEYIKITYEEIETLKKYLSDTDYLILKCIEISADPKLLYSEVINKRAIARKKINTLEEKLKGLET